MQASSKSPGAQIQSQHLQMTNSVSQVTRIYRPSINQPNVPLVSITPNIVRSSLVQARVSDNSSSANQNQQSQSQQQSIATLATQQLQQQQEVISSYDKLIKAVRKIAEKQNKFIQKMNEITENFNNLVAKQTNFEKEVREKLDEIISKYNGICQTSNKGQENDLDDLLETIDLQESISLISVSKMNKPQIAIKSEISGNYEQQSLTKNVRNVRSKYARNMNFSQRRTTKGHNPRFQCNLCEKNYSRNDGLRRHIRREHEDEDEYFENV
ncbi:hypothetical protein PVAND_000441 [Polypedilum vanderplanki]|uniref:C2H2-type domain-containing protein n=1 Tax=Polypedilum vanderplanki TaxID=319348 RepID=A0A9J6BKB7_POLVA|nr:hypothetical protein PVAND_000441 [Polypedilum vanderplanki]